MISFGEMNLEEACNVLSCVHTDAGSLQALTAMRLSELAQAVLSLNNEAAADLSMLERSDLKRTGIDRTVLDDLRDRLYEVCKSEFEEASPHGFEAALLLNAMFSLCSEAAGAAVDSAKAEYCSIAADRMVSGYLEPAKPSAICAVDENSVENQMLISIIHLLAPLGDSACDEPYFQFLQQRVETDASPSPTSDAASSLEKLRLRHLVREIFG